MCRDRTFRPLAFSTFVQRAVIWNGLLYYTPPVKDTIIASSLHPPPVCPGHTVIGKLVDPYIFINLPQRPAKFHWPFSKIIFRKTVIQKISCKIIADHPAFLSIWPTNFICKFLDLFSTYRECLSAPKRASVISVGGSLLAGQVHQMLIATAVACLAI